MGCELSGIASPLKRHRPPLFRAIRLWAQGRVQLGPSQLKLDDRTSRCHHLWTAAGRGADFARLRKPRHGASRRLEQPLRRLEGNFYVCPGGKGLMEIPPRFLQATRRRDQRRHDDRLRTQARLRGLCAQAQVCPNAPARKIARSIHEAARDKARAIAKTEAYAVSRRERKKVEMLFAHLKRILRLDRLRLRGSSGAKDEFIFAT
jgi:hypothetical protein